MTRYFHRLYHLFDLRFDTNYKGTDESIRQNVNFKSANAWTLVFAIFIASVGLNVNSTAVIIGAMLISPLMGPIVGAGYALGINDFSLLKSSGRNLMYAICISLLTSTVYFLLSPFSEVQNELLARTSPNFYDVVIAIFGGAAGIVALSRSEKSNAIPGVAIATALMPPLCTAGFGLATLEWKFFVGAIYLFIINSVFICLSTYVFIRYLKFPKVSNANKVEQKRIHRWIIGIATAVVIPSLVTAWILLSQSTFRHRADKFVEAEIKFKGTFLVDKKFLFDMKKSVIHLTFIGKKLDTSIVDELHRRKNYYGLDEVKLQVDQVAIDEHIDTQLNKIAKRELPSKRLSELELELNALREEQMSNENMLIEAQAFLPRLMGLHLEKDVAEIVWKKNPKSSERKAIEDFIRLRIKRELRFSHAVLI